MERAKQILKDNAEGHHRIAEMLIEHEVITSDDVESVLGPRPWKSRQDELIEDNEQLRLKEQQEAQAKQEAEAPADSDETENATDIQPAEEATDINN